jgi:hypothetical protein
MALAHRLAALLTLSFAGCSLFGDLDDVQGGSSGTSDAAAEAEAEAGGAAALPAPTLRPARPVCPARSAATTPASTRTAIRALRRLRRPAPAAACIGGTCTNQCALGFVDCNGNVTDGCEVDARSDPTNCGNCNSNALRRAGRGDLRKMACEFDCGSLQKCGLSCVDSVGDPENCGGCAIECQAPSNAGAT